MINFFLQKTTKNKHIKFMHFNYKFLDQEILKIIKKN